MKKVIENASSRPEFSIIVSDFDGVVPRNFFLRKMQCLANQTCKDFEVLVYHNGPKQVPYEDEVAGIEFHPRTRFIVTDMHDGCYGHTNRDRGIHEAVGRWIIHTNADNIFYENCIERLKHYTSRKEAQTVLRTRLPSRFDKKVGRKLDKYFGSSFMEKYKYPVKGTISEPQIVIYSILLRGMLPWAQGYHRIGETENSAIVLSGFPVVLGAVDAMQFVMRRDLWLSEGGWFDRTPDADGRMYSIFAQRYHITSVPEVLGEHW